MATDSDVADEVFASVPAPEPALPAEAAPPATTSDDTMRKPDPAEVHHDDDDDDDDDEIIVDNYVEDMDAWSNRTPTSTSNAGRCCHARRPRNYYRRTLDQVVENIDLPPIRKLQVRKFFSRAAEDAGDKAHWYRVSASRLNYVAMIGGIIVTFLVWVRDSSFVSESDKVLVFWVLGALSVIVNIASVLQNSSGFTEIAKIYDELFNELDYVGWSYFSLSGSFEGLTHSQGFPRFTNRILLLKHVAAQALRDARNKKSKSKGDDDDKSKGSGGGGAKLRRRPTASPWSAAQRAINGPMTSARSRLDALRTVRNPRSALAKVVAGDRKRATGLNSAV